MFSFVQPLGAGAFGTVYLVRCSEDGKLYAEKRVQINGQSPSMDMQIQQEVYLLKQLNHKHILRFVEASIQGSYMCIYTEYCPGGDIGVYIRMYKGTAMEESRLLLWIQQITEALQYLHGLWILHRDLKPANILLDANGNIRVADFGIARVLKTQESQAHTNCGTVPYISPETVAGQQYTYKADIYSLGIMMYEMCHMNKLFSLPELIYYMHCYGNLPPLPPGYNGGINKLLTSMMNYDPSYRPSATAILGHDVFKTTQAPPEFVIQSFVPQQPCMLTGNNNGTTILIPSFVPQPCMLTGNNNGTTIVIPPFVPQQPCMQTVYSNGTTIPYMCSS